MEIADLAAAPPFVAEKIALLRMCPTHAEGGIGRKLSDHRFTIYLTKQEYNILKEIAHEKESNSP